MQKMESFRRVVMIQLSAVNIAIQVVLYSLIWFHYYSTRLQISFWQNGHILVICIYALLLIFFSKMYGGLRIGYLKSGEVLFSQIFATICVNVLTYGQISLLSLRLADVVPMLILTVAEAVAAGIWIWISSQIYQAMFPPRSMLLVHGDRSIDDILEKFSSRKDKYQIRTCMHINKGFSEITKESLNYYDAVILWDIPYEVRNRLIKFYFENSIRVYIMPKISDIIVKGADQLHLFDTPILLTREYVLTIEQRAVKRLIDIICSFILCIITSPIMLVTAVSIKLYDKGPVLYKQIRCTKDAQEFYILKFRSMRVDAEKDGVARLAAKNDDRITPIGKFIRAVRIDELPQLLNILKGEMSFIGPRPERPEIIARYLEEMPEFVYRMKVKAGLAGYAQVYGKYNTTPYDKLKLDLFYMENYTIWLDLRLMMLTLKILLKPESTEGIETEQVTAMKQVNANQQQDENKQVNANQQQDENKQLNVNQQQDEIKQQDEDKQSL